MRPLLESLNTVPLAGLMLVVALGFSLGRLSIKGFSLGPAGGTLVVALILGRLGLSFSQLYGGDTPLLTVGAFGFALFVYSVGFEAGPRFFGSIVGGPGWRFVLVGTIVNVVAVGLAVIFGRVFGLGDSVTAGLLSGALTSAPTYAAASEVCSDPTALVVTFALTYPVGLAGVVLLVQLLPRRMGDSLESDDDVSGDDDRRESSGADPEVSRTFEVHGIESIGKPLAELGLMRRTGCTITRLFRDGHITIPGGDTCLNPGDHLMVRGRVDELSQFAEIVGREVYDDEFSRRISPPRRIHLTDRTVVGRTLAEIGLPQRFGCLVTGIERSGVIVEPSADLRIERGDVIEVSGRPNGVRAAVKVLGRFERPSHETDIAIYAAGILIGILVGRLALDLGGFPLSLGSAGGLLLAGIVLGRFRRIGPFTANVPAAARQLVRDLGILLFVAETGVAAGGSSFSVLRENVWLALLGAVLVTAVPLVAAVWFGRRVLLLGPVDAWGSACGGMTSSAALIALRRAADSNEPALSYAASYTVASVLVTVAGSVVVFLVA